MKVKQPTYQAHAINAGSNNYCKKKLEAYKKKADEAYSDVSARDDEIERLQRELDEDMELERKINAELR
ncbi:hypothetical protein DY000_02003860 [Brassica cretica]|uniref:Uncharacterized protein n=1 Tax=Brassica cretica TaxID=69181 RepID=A0ABQ7CK91_BRACR|nr:hypothetical protein DY000_02003860 [Brassica cretica]